MVRTKRMRDVYTKLRVRERARIFLDSKNVNDAVRGLVIGTVPPEEAEELQRLLRLVASVHIHVPVEVMRLDGEAKLISSQLSTLAALEAWSLDRGSMQAMLPRSASLSPYGPAPTPRGKRGGQRRGCIANPYDDVRKGLKAVIPLSLSHALAGLEGIEVAIDYVGDQLRLMDGVPTEIRAMVDGLRHELERLRLLAQPVLGTLPSVDEDHRLRDLLVGEDDLDDVVRW